MFSIILFELILLTVIGAAGGLLSSWLAWNVKGVRFDVHKHANAIIIGILTGMGAALAPATVAHLSELDAAGFYILMIFTFLAAAGIDRFRESLANSNAKQS